MVTIKFSTRAANDPAYIITVGLSRPLKDAFAGLDKSKINKIGRKLTKLLSYKVATALIRNGYELPLPEDYLLKIRGEVTFNVKEEGEELGVEVKELRLAIDIFKKEKSVEYGEGLSTMGSEES